MLRLVKGAAFENHTQAAALNFMVREDVEALSVEAFVLTQLGRAVFVLDAYGHSQFSKVQERSWQAWLLRDFTFWCHAEIEPWLFNRCYREFSDHLTRRIADATC